MVSFDSIVVDQSTGHEIFEQVIPDIVIDPAGIQLGGWTAGRPKLIKCFPTYKKWDNE